MKISKLDFACIFGCLCEQMFGAYCGKCDERAGHVRAAAGNHGKDGAVQQTRVGRSDVILAKAAPHGSVTLGYTATA